MGDFMDSVIDWIMDHPGWFLAIVAPAMVALAILAVLAD